MAKGAQKWEPAVATQAFLVALDISGFSNDPDPDRLLNLRNGFLNTISKTSVVQRSRSALRVHFLGDELRLAFHVDTGAVLIREFLYEVLVGLRNENRSLEPTHQIHLRTVVLAGPVIWTQWHECHFLDGELPAKAQFWLGQIAKSDVAMDASFKNYLDVAGVCVSTTTRTIALEPAYMLSLTLQIVCLTTFSF